MIQPIDPRLTRVPPEPPAPPRLCRDSNGRVTVCNRAIPIYIDALRAWGRGLAGKLHQIEQVSRRGK